MTRYFLISCHNTTTTTTTITDITSTTTTNDNNNFAEKEHWEIWLRTWFGTLRFSMLNGENDLNESNFCLLYPCSVHPHPSPHRFLWFQRATFHP